MLQRKAHGTTKAAEDGFALVVGVEALQVVDVQVTPAWLTKPWKNSKTSCVSSWPMLPAVNFTSMCRPGRPKSMTVAQGFTSSGIGMTVAANAFLVADGLGKGLAR